jgi:hypothetical protein
MKLDPRILIPAALVAAALAIPATSAGTPPNQGHCPDGFVLLPGGGAFNPNKDTNHNSDLCVKPTDPEHVKDDNCAAPCEKDPVTGLYYDVVDDIIDPL